MNIKSEKKHPCIVLIGFKSCGKTTIGKLIAKQTDAFFIDTDEYITNSYAQEYKTFLTVADIYKKHGADFFRTLESTVIKNIFHFINDKNNIKNMDYLKDKLIVISTGGGCILNTDNVNYLKEIGTLFYIETDAQTLQKRNTTYLGRSFLDIYAERKNIYENIFNKKVLAANKTPIQIAEEIIHGL